jgi:hypothetical protein
MINFLFCSSAWCHFSVFFLCAKNTYPTLAAAVASRIQNEATFCYAAPYTNWRHCTFCALQRAIVYFFAGATYSRSAAYIYIAVSALRVFGAELIRTRRQWLNIPPAFHGIHIINAFRRAALWWVTHIHRILLTVFCVLNEKSNIPNVQKLNSLVSLVTKFA